MARGSQIASLVKYPDGISSADGKPWVCLHAAGTPHGVARYTADIDLRDIDGYSNATKGGAGVGALMHEPKLIQPQSPK